MTLVYKMCVAEKSIFMIVLVLSDLLPTSIKIMSAGSTCNHPWKEDFGFKINESVGASVKNLPSILKGFLDITNQDNLEERLKEPMKICISSLDCRLYTVLDKNNTNALTLCIVTKKVQKCTAFTCTCPDVRSRRFINTDYGQVIPNSKSKFGITNPICKFKFICDERICDTAQRDFTITENNRFENPVKYTTTMDRLLKENNIGLKEGNTTWLYFLIFAIGVGIGTVIGSLATYIWFKRTYLLPKTSSVVNGTYNREKTTTVIHDVTEHSEIPECSKTTYYQPIEDFHHQHQESLRNKTHSKFRAFPSLVTHVDMCEHSFKSEDQKKQDHMKNMEQKKKFDLLFSGNSKMTDSIAIANKEANSDDRQEKECNSNDANFPVMDEYMIPLQNTNIEKNQENMMEYPCVVGAMNHSPKEECKIMTHTAQEDNINSNSVYFELSAASENEKLLVPECTNYLCEDQGKKADRLETKHVNQERNAASECEKGDDQTTQNVYFELSETADCIS